MNKLITVPKHFKQKKMNVNLTQVNHSGQEEATGRRKAGSRASFSGEGGVDLGQQHGDCVVPTRSLAGPPPSSPGTCGPVLGKGVVTEVTLEAQQ